VAEVVSVKVEGLAELEERVRTVPVKIAKAVVRRGLEASGEVIRFAMFTRAKRATGFLAAHIATKTKVSSSEFAGTVSIGVLQVNYPFNERSAALPSTARKSTRARKRRTVYASTVARYLEFGTRKMPAFPFMRTAFESSKDDALTRFADAAMRAFNETAR
jgi:HK97 gp10 family phage protein